MSCNLIYPGWENDTGAECMLCRRNLCPQCCPKIQEEGQYLKTLFPMCGPCVEPKMKLISYPHTEANHTNSGQEEASKPPPRTEGNHRGGDKSEEVCRFYLRKQCRHFKSIK